MLQVVGRLVSLREQEIEMGRRCSEVLVPQQGSVRQRGRYRVKHRHDRRNMFLRSNDLWPGCLSCHWEVATQKHSEQQNEPFVQHEISLLSNSCSRAQAKERTPPPGPFQLPLENEGPESAREELKTNLLRREFPGLF